MVAAVVELIDVPALTGLYRTYTRPLGRIYGRAARPDFIAAIAALLGVLVFDTLPGLFIGIVTSLLLLLYRASEPYVAELGILDGPDARFVDLSRHPDSHRIPGVAVLRVEGGIFFANAEAVRAAVTKAVTPGTRAVVLDAETVAFVDVTGVRVLGELADELDRSGIHLAIAHGIGQVRDIVRTAGDLDLDLYATVADAISALQPPREADGHR